MKLYPHNQKAYNNVISIFETDKRTCIVHATGTGKSLIAAKLIFDNPTAKFLFVAPTVFIFREIKKHIKGYKYNIQFRTYSSFLNKSLNSFSDYDYIILDEFHRIGAEQWGEAIKTILEQNINAKILGLSATHIRFLDDNRNMAEEIFENNIASFLSLGEAIEQGIHRVPIYVSALYNIKEILDNFQKKLIRNSDKKKIEKLNSNRIIWEKSNGVDYILKKHLTKQRKKILVFCKDFQHINFVKMLIEKPLKDIYKNHINFQTIYSAMGVKETMKVFNNFEVGVNTQVLFSIDMLNEGVHVNGADTILMFRDTISPNIYYQQIGRCFAIGQYQDPLIFDFVNNFNIKNSFLNIKQNFYQDFNHSNTTDFYKSRDTIINFYDETLDFQLYLQNNSLENSWEENFHKYSDFRIEMKREPTQKEMKWLSTQRYFEKKGILSQDKIDKLISVDPDFFKDKFNSWEKNLQKYSDFRDEMKREPLQKEMTWVNSQKIKYKKGELSQNHIDAILKINPSFFKNKFDSWEKNLQKYSDFRDEMKREPKAKEMTWINTQKMKYKKNKLSQKHIDAILNINPNFFK